MILNKYCVKINGFLWKSGIFLKVFLRRKKSLKNYIQMNHDFELTYDKTINSQKMWNEFCPNRKYFGQKLVKSEILPPNLWYCDCPHGNYQQPYTDNTHKTKNRRNCKWNTDLHWYSYTLNCEHSTSRLPSVMIRCLFDWLTDWSI